MKTSALSRLTNAFAGSSCWKLLLEGHTPPSLRDTPSILEGEQVTQLHGKGWESSVILVLHFRLVVNTDNGTGKGENLSEGGEHRRVDDSHGRYEECRTDEHYAESDERNGCQ